MTPVTILVGAVDATPNKHVKLLLDPSSTKSIVSSRLVKNVLQIAIAQMESSDQEPISVLGRELKIVGEINVSWKVPQYDSQTRVMSCHVVDDFEGPFDIIAGASSINAFEDLVAFAKAQMFDF